MVYSEVEKIIKDKKSGRFFSICYEVEVPIQAQYKNEFKLKKIEKQVVRTGIKYQNINVVKPTLIERIFPKTNVRNWLIPNKVFENINTNEVYLRVGILSENSHKVSTYILTDLKTGKAKTYERNDIIKYMLKSYAKTEEEFRPIKEIKISNIISIQ